MNAVTLPVRYDWSTNASPTRVTRRRGGVGLTPPKPASW